MGRSGTHPTVGLSQSKMLAVDAQYFTLSLRICNSRIEMGDKRLVWRGRSDRGSSWKLLPDACEIRGYRMLRHILKTEVL